MLEKYQKYNEFLQKHGKALGKGINGNQLKTKEGSKVKDFVILVRNFLQRCNKSPMIIQTTDDNKAIDDLIEVYEIVDKENATEDYANEDLNTLLYYVNFIKEERYLEKQKKGKKTAKAIKEEQKENETKVSDCKEYEEEERQEQQPAKEEEIKPIEGGIDENNHWENIRIWKEEDDDFCEDIDEEEKKGMIREVQPKVRTKEEKKEILKYIINSYPTQREFCEKYGFEKRNVINWKNTGSCPDYVITMLYMLGERQL